MGCFLVLVLFLFLFSVLFFSWQAVKLLADPIIPVRLDCFIISENTEISVFNWALGHGLYSKRQSLSLSCDFSRLLPECLSFAETFLQFSWAKIPFPLLKNLWCHRFSLISAGSNFCCTSQLLALHQHKFSQWSSLDKSSCRSGPASRCNSLISRICSANSHCCSSLKLPVFISSTQRHFSSPWPPLCSAMKSEHMSPGKTPGNVFTFSWGSSLNYRLPNAGPHCVSLEYLFASGGQITDKHGWEFSIQF